MSLLQHHMLRVSRLPPTLIRAQYSSMSQATPWNLTLSATPVPGSLMVVLISANQSDNYGISGWTQFWTATGSTAIGWYKFAGPSESTTISITWSTGGVSQGSMHYYEFSGIDNVSPIAYAAGSVNLLNSTVYSYPAHNIPDGTFAIQLNHTGDNAVSATISDGYTILGISNLGGHRSRSAYKSYSLGQNGVNPVWTYSGIDNHEISIIGIRGSKN